MKPIVSIFFSIALTFGGTIHLEASELTPGMEIRFCHGTGGWVPYDFYRIVDGKKTKESIGYSIDMLNEIFIEHDLKLKSHYLPWKRCLLKTKNGDMDIVLSATHNEERARDYLLSTPYYSLTPNFFYMKSKYPQGITISSPQDLLSYRMCGLLGYNYRNFGVPNENVYMGARSFRALMMQLELGRCDVILARYETLAGRAMIGENFLDDRIGKGAIPGIHKEPFIMLLSKQTGHAHELKKIIDDGIYKLKQNGKLKKILEKYLR